MKRLFNLKNKKKISLSLVALILVMLMTIGITYSWIDDVKQIEIKTEVGGNDTPLKTGVDINAKVNVTKKNNTINLGNLIENSDIKLNDGEGELKYDDNGGTKNYNTDTINQKKGYFYESGDMHLSSCYSDGENFYFARSNGNYREGNKDDENVNYISFTVQVSSPYADVDFWFKSVPKVYKHGTNTAISTARYAINANGQNHVYSSTGEAKTVALDNNGQPTTSTPDVQGVRKTTTYTYNHEDNTTEDQGANSNVLFSVKKGSTINVTFKIWNEGSFASNIAATDIDMSIVSSWAYTRTVKIVDRTTNSNGTSWIDDDNATMYFTLPSFMEERTDNVDSWDEVSSTDDYTVPFYEINNSTYKHNATDSEGEQYTYYEVDVPLVFNNEEMIIYRCDTLNNGGWNHGTHSGKDNGHGVTYWNWWRTFLPNTYDDATYTIYGSSYDNVASWRFDNTDSTATYKGYGTWGGVDHIQVFSHYGEADYASKVTGANFFVRDYSDESTSGEIYTYIMYRADNNTNTPWRVYLPKSSSLIQFYYYQQSGNNPSVTGTWGYKSWYSSSSYYNPQQRPLKSSGLYAANSKTYHLARNYGTDRGWGYWSNAEGVYLIKSGFLSSTSTTAHAYMFDRETLYLKPNSNWKQSNPVFKAHLWNSSTNTTVEMHKRTDDTWGINVPSGNWTNVQFMRVDPSNSNNVWNRTADLEYKNGQVFSISSGQWDNATGTWDPWQKSEWPGETLTRLQDTNGANVSYTWNGNTAQVWKTESARVFNSVIFNNGYSGSVGTNQTGNLNLFPGCFYQVDGDKWYGSLSDTSRSDADVGVDAGGDGGSSSGDITGYTVDSGFTVQLGGNTYTVYTNSAEDAFKVRLPLASGDNWTTFQKNYLNYGSSSSGQYYAVPRDSGLNIYLTKGTSNNISLRASSAGSYIVTFTYDNGNTNKIIIDSAIKE